MLSRGVCQAVRSGYCDRGMRLRFCHCCLFFFSLNENTVCVWCWWTREVEKPKVLIFGIKKYFKLVRKASNDADKLVFNWDQEWGKRILFIVWSKNGFQSAFSPMWAHNRQFLLRVQRKATPASVLIYWVLDPTVGPGGKMRRYLVFVLATGLSG